MIEAGESAERSIEGNQPHRSSQSAKADESVEAMAKSHTLAFAPTQRSRHRT